MIPCRSIRRWLALSIAVSACGAQVRSADSPDGGADVIVAPRRDASRADVAATDASDVPMADVAPGELYVSCQPGAWCWQHPVPQGNGLNAVYTVSEREAWAVGDHGAIVRYIDGAWRHVRSPVDVTLRRIWGSGANDVWAWGSREATAGRQDYALIRWNGARWSSVNFGGLPVIRTLNGSAADNVWIVTASNTLDQTAVLRWNGNAFVAGPQLPGGERFVSLCTRGASEAWASTNDARNSFPIALFRWNGTAWSERFRADMGERLNSDVACAADGVALATLFDAARGEETVLQVSDERVGGGPLPLPRSTSPRLVQTPHGEVYYVSNLAGMQWTPMGWSRRFAFPGDRSVFGFHFDLTTDGRAGWLADGSASLLPWGPMGWGIDPRALRASVTAFFGRDGVDPTTVFGAGVVGQRTGDRWTFAALPSFVDGMPFAVNDVWTINANEAWLVGRGGAIGRWSESTRTVTPAMFGGEIDMRTLIDIDGSDANTVWAVGDDAKVLRLDGGRWSPPPVALPERIDGPDGFRLTDLTLTDVSVASANDVLILGNDPAGGRFVTLLFRFDGARWQTELSAGTTAGHLARTPDGTIYLTTGEGVRFRRRDAMTWTTTERVDGSIQSLWALPSGTVMALVLGARASQAQLYELAPGATRFTALGPLAVAQGLSVAHRGAQGALWLAGGASVLRYTPSMR